MLLFQNQDMWKNKDDNCTVCQCIRGKIKCESVCKIPVCQEVSLGLISFVLML